MVMKTLFYNDLRVGLVIGTLGWDIRSNKRIGGRGWVVGSAKISGERGCQNTQREGVVENFDKIKRKGYL